MPPDKQIECRISWDDILYASNSEQFIWRMLQQKDIDAYVNNGRFEATTGKLHVVDDIATRERVYVWCPDRDAYPICNCLMCENRSPRVMTPYSLDFKCQLIQELCDCGAVMLHQLWHERNRVHEIVQREREIAERQRQDREREERRARDQEQQQQLAQEARE